MSGSRPFRGWGLLPILPFYFLVTLSSCDPEKTPAVARQIRTRHVVILVMDGARYTETWGDPSRQYVSNIAFKFAPIGVIFTNFRNKGVTVTVPGHTALSTGVYESIANDGTQLPYNPGILQYYLGQTGNPTNQAWLLTSKDKLVVLSDCVDSGWNGRHRPSLSCGLNGDGTGGYAPDAVTFSNVVQVLTNHAPAVMLVNFKDPDECAHNSDWSGYVNAIRNIDGYAGRIWDTIQADTNLANSTALFIVNDHGRHTADYSSHGDSCDGCRHILCVAVGPDFRTNFIDGADACQIDLTATAAYLLRISMPTSRGRLMDELFTDTASMAFDRQNLDR